LGIAGIGSGGGIYDSQNNNFFIAIRWLAEATANFTERPL